MVAAVLVFDRRDDARSCHLCARCRGRRRRRRRRRRRPLLLLLLLSLLLRTSMMALALALLRATRSADCYHWPAMTYARHLRHRMAVIFHA